MSRESLVVKDKTILIANRNLVQFTFILRKSCNHKAFKWISPFKASIVMSPEKRRSGIFLTIEMAKRLHFSMSMRKKLEDQ